MFARILALSVLCVTTGPFGPAFAAEGADNLKNVIQVVADLTLIDGACRADVVNFGVAFRFARENGVPEVSLLPTGLRFGEFETVMRRRRARFTTDELCGEIAANYAEALPGSVTFATATSR